MTLKQHSIKKLNFNTWKKALNKLSPENRELILLTRFQKLKYKEVAMMLGMSEGAVKVKAHRAIKQLRIQYFKTELS